MKQVVKLFTGYASYLDNDINEFLKEHPDHTINTITLNTKYETMLIIALIVFNVKEPTYSKAVGVTRSGETKTIKYEDKNSNKYRCNKCVYQLGCQIDDKHRDNCPHYKRDASDGGYYG